jgi:hypothetical protein
MSFYPAMSLYRRVLAAPKPSSVTVGIVGLASGYLIVLAWTMGHVSFDVWGGFVVAPILIALTVPLAMSASRADGDPWIGRVVMSAVVLKLFGSIVRYYVAFSVYGAADATGYDAKGRVLAPMFRSGDFTVDIGKKVAGTGFIELVTGGVYTFTGPSKLAGFFVFSWLGFVGLFLFYRAFRIAFPEGDAYRYALLVFLLPSLLFWPSSIGKESWMMFNLGILAYGAARILAGRYFGFPILLLGLLGTAIVRPHVTLIAIVALVGAYLLRRSPRQTAASPVAKLLMLGILTVVTLGVMSQFDSFFGVSVLDHQGTDQVLARASQQSDEGGSAYEAVRPSSPAAIAQASIAVIFRPWPYEAHNAQAMFASLEGVLLLGLVLTSLPRLASVPRAMFRRPYVAFALVYSLLFTYAFAAIGNFGILARQRVQLYPFLIVLLCVPAGFGTERDSEGEEPDSVTSSPGPAPRSAGAAGNASDLSSGAPAR